MKDFVFHNPVKIIFGKDKNAVIGKEIQRKGIQKVLLVYGQGSIKKNGLYDVIISSLNESGIEYKELSGIIPNPVLSKVKEGIAIAKENDIEAILAIGGGSVIDSAKAIAAGVFIEGDVWDMFVPEIGIKPKKALPIFVSLTMSATGSEANAGSVITNDKTGEKFFFSSPLVYPQITIIDPKIQFTLPDYQLKCGASDIIAHTMELYLDKENNYLINKFAISIIDTVMDNVVKLLKNPNDYEARSEYILSAMFALNGLLGIGKSGGDWVSHFIEHAISGLYPEITHGAGLAVILPAYLKYMYPYAQNLLDIWAEDLWGVKGDYGIEMLKEWYNDIGLPVSLKDIGVKASDYKKIVQITMRMAPLGNIKQIDEEDLFRILKLAE